MYIPPLQPVANSDIRINGDVEIHPTASIAVGVVLQAAPSSRIVIGANACIGMGVVVSAYDGTVEIGSGVTLGSGVLVIGASKIGNNACVGISSTILNSDIESMKVIPQGSVIGDNSRQVELGKDKPDPPSEKIKTEFNNNGLTPEIAPDPWESEQPEVIETIAEIKIEKAPIQNSSRSSPAIGKVYLDRLLLTLFPHRESQNNSHPNSS